MELTRQGSAEYTRQLSDEARQQRESLERESAGERALEKQLDEELLRVKQQLALHEAGSRIDAPQPEPEPAGMPSEGVPAQRPHTAPAGAASGAFEAASEGAGESVIVVCRVRPLNARESSANKVSTPLLQYSADGRGITVDHNGGGMGGTGFSFRRVFQPSVSQQGVYDAVGGPMVDAVVDGFNAAMICYGQTGRKLPSCDKSTERT
eukprot:COSAG05_NODE_6624_length_929_cov_34.614458_2_plen_208_part_00